eukprot:TRINITY_DN676_c0_g1_i1.p1 TRINITY_DN676_c0_g1~~TRINITY_DN676_c0_g1_i1.p1  ORF type:complete len:361 (-),score=69.74 TRINITY_DN676_c0_g1_i1:31-1065(-)
MTVNPNHDDLSSFPFVSFQQPHSNWVRDIIQLNDNTLLSCSFDKTVKRWTQEGHLLNSFLNRSGIVDCVMEVDDNTFISGSNNKMKVWNKTTGECLHTIQTSSGVTSLLRLRNNSTFLCGLGDGKIEERRTDNYQTLHALYQHTRAVSCMCELSNGNDVVSGSWDRTLKVWDMNTKTVIRTLTGHSSVVNRVIEMRDTTTIASCSMDTTVRMWDVRTGECVRVLHGHASPVFGLVELRDGTLLSGAFSEPIREWNNKGEFVATHKLMTGVISMRELRDGSVAIGGDGCGAIQVRKTWNVEHSLVDLCCELIARHLTFFDMTMLSKSLPRELYELIIKKKCYHHQ